MKKEKIGSGFRNGYGGGVRSNESPNACAVREALEEGRIKTWVEDLEPIALLHCHNRTEEGKNFLCAVHVFQTKFWLGEPQETAEMGPPAWFPISHLPLEELMLTDRIWLPRFFRDQKLLFVKACYGPRQQTLAGEVEIEEVAALPEE